LAEHPDSIDLRYLATRVLARSGATDQAAALYKRFELDRRRKGDIAALGARIAKDQALAASVNRQAALRAAARAYGRIFARTRNHYPAVNAATLYLLAGDHKRSRLYAHRAVTASTRGPADTAYYRAATRAEAALICGDMDLARRSLQDAARHLHGDFAAAATTRKQLRLVCRATGASPDVLDLIRSPAVLQYYGPGLVTRAPRGPFDRRRERDFADRVGEYLAHHQIGYAYGSLSAGGDILCAEACLRAGVQLHVILPFCEDEFVETMVRAAGSSWVRRFRACLGGATSVTFATTDSYQGDNSLFGYSCGLAMGTAILHAERLDGPALHLSLHTDGWDPDPGGYALNMTMWQAQGRSSHRIAAGAPIVPAPRAQKSPGPERPIPPRFARAVVFGDVKGFSRTPDYLIPVFQQRLMGAIAAALDRYGRHVLYRASWGDAIYVVIDDPIVAAECCLVIQEAITKARPWRYGLSPELALRLAAHFGPVYDGHDPICDEPTFFGAHTTIAARMEPVTVPGRVYVTEAMAAAIAMAHAPRLSAEYVGNVPMAKGFGSIRMYALKRT
jgi:hypothetical protein